MMFQAPTTAASVERFIGGLTIALGLGALIPRAGYGLYAMLEAEGTRGAWAMLMLTVGVWLICASYVTRMPGLRLSILAGGIIFWAILAYKFFASQLWGASLQAMVVILFGVDTWIRLAYGFEHERRKTKATAENAIRR